MRQYRDILAISAALLALPSCGPSDDGAQSNDPAEAVSPRPDTSESTATLGHITYSFDPRLLTAADVDIAIPPANDRHHTATKLIPADRAARIGQEGCMYGADDVPTRCNAEREPGLALALLPRPIGEYRGHFQGQSAYGVDTVERSGVEGFAYRSQADAVVTEYLFLPSRDRTILIARSVGDNLPDHVANEFEEVIYSIASAVREADGVGRAAS
ncbi:hypothetical protein [Aurantiacibacter aquimixticola]|uniref:DUF5642 domain-containing protein n=1 Tax=Aurantiacibacter aquimixticola TaxID=1958945 RepID=A0A419RQZ7_9SPHN|nr:hypothetical protein [Aurantiacibacter aquimixticola]RJY08223.1 hypothetical protein D6201_01595 [Aurantiacibacter aquimixticola]